MEIVKNRNSGLWRWNWLFSEQWEWKNNREGSDGGTEKKRGLPIVLITNKDYFISILFKTRLDYELNDNK